MEESAVMKEQQCTAPSMSALTQDSPTSSPSSPTSSPSSPTSSPSSPTSSPSSPTSSPSSPGDDVVTSSPSAIAATVTVAPSTVPSFIQGVDGGLVAESAVPVGTVFGPYTGGIRTLKSATSEGEYTAFKICDSAGTAYTVDVDEPETGRPLWWTCIKQTAEWSKANVMLIPHDGQIYLKTMTVIAKSQELQLIMKAPSDGSHDVGGDIKSAPTASGASDDATSSTPTRTTPGPPFKCSFCCIEFRYVSNLEAHRVYYCPGTASKPLPTAKRRATASGWMAKIGALHPGYPEPNCIETFVCQLCQSSFEYKRNCESHMLLLHCDETANLCKFCNFIGADRKGLCRHVFSHVRVETRDFSPGMNGSPLPGKQNEKRNSNQEVGMTSSRGFPVASSPDDNRSTTADVEDTAAADSNGHNFSRVRTMPTSLTEEFKSCRTIRHVSPANSTDQRSLDSDGRQDRETPPCSQCDSATSRQSSLRKHAIQHNVNATEVSPASTRAGSCRTIRHVSPANSTDRRSLDSDGRQDRETPPCSQCDSAASRQSSLRKHPIQHNVNATEVSPVSTGAGTPITSPAGRGSGSPSLNDTVCHFCHIFFKSRENYTAHKQYYCAGRLVDTNSPDRNSAQELQTVESTFAANNSKRSDSLTSESYQWGPRVPPHPASPYSDDGHHALQLNRRTPSTRARSIGTPPVQPIAPPPFAQSPQLFQLGGGGTPKYPPPTVVGLKGGRQLANVTPVKIPGSPAERGDGRCPLEGEQPLDLSTKPKTPPLTGRSKVLDTGDDRSVPPLATRMTPVASRCEECDITFMKTESLLVHKQYYCASRHVPSPHTVAQPPNCYMPTVENKPEQKEIPQSGLSPNPNHLQTQHAMMTSSPVPSDRSTPCNGRAYRTPASNDAQLQTPHHSVRVGTSSPRDRTSACQQPLQTARCNGVLNPSNPKLKRAGPEETNERRLPPIKRKRNHALAESSYAVHDAMVNGGLSNGTVVKAEESTLSPVSCQRYTSNGTGNVEGKDAIAGEQRSAYDSKPLSDRHRQQELPTTCIRIKLEPADDIQSTNGQNHSHTPTERYLHHQDGVKSGMPTSLRSPLVPSQPVSPVATPLTVPLHQSTTPRQTVSVGDVTLNSYLTKRTRPMVRGLKPTVKHCRSCNISFSSLSTFIAHKKYYCASHHQNKNASI